VPDRGVLPTENNHKRRPKKMKNKGEGNTTTPEKKSTSNATPGIHLKKSKRAQGLCSSRVWRLEPNGKRPAEEKQKKEEGGVVTSYQILGTGASQRKIKLTKNQKKRTWKRDAKGAQQPFNPKSWNTKQARVRRVAGKEERTHRQKWTDQNAAEVGGQKKKKRVQGEEPQ